MGAGSNAGMMSAAIQLMGQQNALGALGKQYDMARNVLTSKDYYEPYAQAGNSGLSMYQDALGLNGAAGNQRATNAFQAGPGYQFQMDQGMQALNRSAASRGMLASGNNSADLMRYGQGLANQEHGNWLSRLGGLGNMGMQAAQGQTGRQNTLSALDYGYGQGQAGIYQHTADAVSNAMNNGLMSDAASAAQRQQNMFKGILGGLQLGGSLLGGML